MVLNEFIHHTYYSDHWICILYYIAVFFNAEHIWHRELVGRWICILKWNTDLYCGITLF